MQLLQNKAGNMGSTFAFLGKISFCQARFWSWQGLLLGHGLSENQANRDFGVSKPYFFQAPAAQVPAAVLWRAVALHETGLPGRGLAGSLGGLSSFYRIRDHSAAFTK